MTAISGYTVYQAGIMPLEAAAIAAATEADKPRLTEHQRNVEKYNDNNRNLGAQISDLRAQNKTASADKDNITGKGADWKRNQIQNSIDARNQQIQTLLDKQANLTAPGEFTSTQPKAIPAEQSLPILARAFAFELIMIMFMLFARFAKDAHEQQQTEIVADIIRLTEQADASMALLSSSIEGLQKTVDAITTASLGQLAEATQTATHAANNCNDASRTITASLGQLAEATQTATHAANNCNDASRYAADINVALTSSANTIDGGIIAATKTTKLLSESTQTAADAQGLLVKTIEDSATQTTKLSAEIDRATTLATHLQLAFAPFAPDEGTNAGTNTGTNGANQTHKEADPYQVLLYRLKHQLINPRPTGKLPVDHLKEFSGLGRKLIEKAQAEATEHGWLERNPDGSYSYPKPTNINVVSLPMRATS
ncbi:methyl-accepting chemotaxis protein [Candidatus Thiothrix sp. Deng01]|uniref:Methyl-accepting chemotaxis protein n=1 Tax=Candidatus Thiothrix phosphatis TaxID=3112415 RepID=A0ABU6D1V3_9GAMM|nr:methyl-accepting chemotaxis protein [Candidatus Thiothrix sp. Deng01]MEB4592821.1 methyl-accepting chemotaxis protein [Candidatus Thiothrix sp. Deng01]